MRLVRNGSLCLEERSSLEKVFVVHLSEGSMDSGPAPSRATPPRRFGPRALARFTRARLPGTARHTASLSLASVAAAAALVSADAPATEDLARRLPVARTRGPGPSGRPSRDFITSDCTLLTGWQSVAGGFEAYPRH